MTNLTSFAAVMTAISSSLGRVICLSGAIHPLAITKLDTFMFDKKATAPCTLVLASANTCNYIEVTSEVLFIIY